MKRRDFLKSSSTLALGATAIIGGGLLACDNTTQKDGKLSHIKKASKAKHKMHFNMADYGAPAIENVRVGIIGLGNRGVGAVKRLSYLDGVEIKALCDNRPERVKKSQEILSTMGMPSAEEYSGSDKAWEKMVQREDLDLIYIATPWELHTPMCLYGMEQGKHVACEVPIATTVEDCWKLVKTSEQTKKHCMMLENCCYDFFEMLTLSMAQQGYFGDLVHAEGAYIHTLLEHNFSKTYYADMWRLKAHQKYNGNLYPTHGLGPIAFILGINRGDKMDYMSAVQSNDFSMYAEAQKRAKEDPAYYKEFVTNNYRGNMSTSIIRTAKGRTMMIQHDVSSIVPYSRIHKIVGTTGEAVKYPVQLISEGHSWLSNEKTPEKMESLKEQYTFPFMKDIKTMAKKVGGHGGMDFIMDWRLISALRTGMPLDQNVYDAASWSVIFGLSRWSVANKSQSIDIPDFTCGAWEKNPKLDFQSVKVEQNQFRDPKG